MLSQERHSNSGLMGRPLQTLGWLGGGQWFETRLQQAVVQAKDAALNARRDVRRRPRAAQQRQLERFDRGVMRTKNVAKPI